MHRSKRARIASLAAVLVLAVGSCVEAPGEPPGTTRAPIINGTPDTIHTGVGALVIDVGGGSVSLCTGTVIADGWVLTAAYCVAGLDPADIMFTNSASAFDAGSEFYVVRAIHLHPDYTPPAGTDPVRNNLALLEVVGLTVVPAYTLNTSALSAGLSISWVGYGADDASPMSGDGTRRSGSGTIDSVFLTEYTYAFDSSLPCGGDAGAPAFAVIGGSERVVGIVTSVDEGCAAYGTDTRVDAYADWIAAVLAGAADCDPTGGDCAEGACMPLGAGGGYDCFPSDGIRVGGACDADPESWSAAVPCADGSYCLQRSDEPHDGECLALCRTADDCAADELCEIPLFAEIPDLGACLPAAAADADADADSDADPDAEDDADADAAEDVPAEDTAPPVDGTDDASGDVPDAGDGDGGCGCRAAGSPGDFSWLLPGLAVAAWVRRRRGGATTRAARRTARR